MTEIIESPSPNFNERKFALDMLVLHYTGMATGPAAIERMSDPVAEVSSHYMVDIDGSIYRLVDEDKRAWHAGVSSWQGDTDLNSRSIGIEIANGGHDIPLEDGSLPPYPDAQIRAVIALCQDILARHDIPQTRIVGHSDIAPARKTDPGEIFPWKAFAEKGIGLWPDEIATDLLIGKGLEPGATGPMVARMQESLKAIGYGIEVTSDYDEATETVVRAFQRRYVQDFVTGEADLKTLTLIERVARMVTNPL